MLCVFAPWVKGLDLLLLNGVVGVELVFLWVDEFDVVVELWSDFC